MSLAGVRVAIMTAAIVYGLATLPPLVFPVWRQMNVSPTNPDRRTPTRRENQLYQPSGNPPAFPG